VDVDQIFRPEVFSIAPTETLVEAARRMRSNEVSSLMVRVEEKFVGIITERDLARAAALGENPHTAFVADYMTDHPVAVNPTTGIREAAAEMLELDVRHLPVGEDGDIVGMISLRDLLTVVVEGSNV
jgi:CBS domain-containing protein